MVAPSVSAVAWLQVGSIVNFSLMYFLAPTAGASAAGMNLLQRLFSEQTLLAWGAPGAPPACLPPQSLPRPCGGPQGM